MLQEEEFINLLKEKKLNTPLILKAFLQAKKSHKNHRRFSGKPEFNDHILFVAKELILSFGTHIAPEYIVASALLHDVLEDDPKMTHRKFRMLFPARVYKIVAALTKKPEDNHSEMSENEISIVNRKVIEKLRNEDFDVQLIKLSDRYSNIVSLEEIEYTRPDTYRRYVKETDELFLPFAKEVSEYFYNKLRTKIAELRLA